jgi:hypothetical protein
VAVHWVLHAGDATIARLTRLPSVHEQRRLVEQARASSQRTTHLADAARREAATARRHRHENQFAVIIAQSLGLTPAQWLGRDRKEQGER